MSEFYSHKNLKEDSGGFELLKSDLPNINYDNTYHFFDYAIDNGVLECFFGAKTHFPSFFNAINSSLQAEYLGRKTVMRIDGVPLGIVQHYLFSVNDRIFRLGRAKHTRRYAERISWLPASIRESFYKHSSGFDAPNSPAFHPLENRIGFSEVSVWQDLVDLFDDKSQVHSVFQEFESEFGFSDDYLHKEMRCFLDTREHEVYDCIGSQLFVGPMHPGKIFVLQWENGVGSVFELSDSLKFLAEYLQCVIFRSPLLFRWR